MEHGETLAARSDRDERIIMECADLSALFKAATSRRTPKQAMNPERHQRVMQILGEAIEREPESRDGWVDTVCAGDEALRAVGS